MKTLISTLLITVLTLGFLLAVNTDKADAWFRGPRVGVSVVVPPFGLAIGDPYYYPGPVYAAPPYPIYEPYYYGPYYRPFFFGHRHFGHRPVWRGDWHGGHTRWGGRH